MLLAGAVLVLLNLSYREASSLM